MSTAPRNVHGAFAVRKLNRALVSKFNLVMIMWLFCTDDWLESAVPVEGGLGKYYSKYIANRVALGWP